MFFFFLTKDLDVLVSSIREAKRLPDLTPTEINDLFQSAVKVQKAVEKMYNSDSSTLAIQDGQNAGQTVKVLNYY